MSSPSQRSTRSRTDSPVASPKVESVEDSSSSEKKTLLALRQQVVEYKQLVIQRLLALKQQVIAGSEVAPTPKKTPINAQFQEKKLHRTEIRTARRKLPTHIRRFSTAPRVYGPVREYSRRTIEQDKSEAPRPQPTPTNAEDHVRLYKSSIERKAKVMDEISKVISRRESIRLPAFPEPSIRKTHWDFVMDEMKWMATDFIQERRWKYQIFRQLSKEAVNKKNEETLACETEKRTIARTVALKVSSFWRSIERVAARTRLNNELSMLQQEEATSSVPVLPADTETYDTILNQLPRKALPEHRQEALKWMLGMNANQTNFCLNDQFGLAKASTVCAFLSCLAKLDAPQSSLPHLILVNGHTLHKWIHFFKFWLPDSNLIVYGGSVMQKRTKQRQWSDREQKIHSVLCYITDAVYEKATFAEQQWSCVISEAPEETTIYSVLNAFQSTQRRILVAHDGLNDIHRATWSGFLQLDDRSTLQDCCLRRLRSQVETEFHTLDEQSTVCSLTHSQKRSYRDVLLSSTGLDSGDIKTWLKLILKLRGVCNGVEIVGKSDKICHADLRTMEECSGKLTVLGSLLLKLEEERKRVVIYAQMGDLLELVEFYVGLLRMSCVRITGDATSQQRALEHFALRQQVQVALVSTRCAAIPSLSSEANHAVTVYGAKAVIVLDSDWDPIVDAKIQASWQHLVVDHDVSVYRFHCEDTIEESLLRSGSCLTETLFGEVTTRGLVQSSVDTIPSERPVWWSSVKTKDLLLKAYEVCADYTHPEQLEHSLNGTEQEFEPEEHILLSNTEELLPIQWYGVNVMQSRAKAAAENEDVEGFSLHDDLNNPNDENSNVQLFYSDPSNWEREMMKLKSNTNDVVIDLYQMEEKKVQDRLIVQDVPETLGIEYIYQIKPQPVKSKKTEGLASIKPIKVKKQRLSKAEMLLEKKRKHGTLTSEEKAALKRHRMQAATIDAFGAESLLGHAFGEDEDDMVENEYEVAGSSSSSAHPKKVKIKGKKHAATQEMAREYWTSDEDGKVLELRQVYGANWNLICCLLNDDSSCVYGSRIRSGRQCSERFTRLTTPQTDTEQPSQPVVPSTAFTQPLDRPKLIPNTILDHPVLDESIESLFLKWSRQEEPEVVFEAVGERTQKELSNVYGQIIHSMRGKRPPPAIPGTESKQSAIVRQHPSHTQATGSSGVTTATMSPEEVIEKSKQAAIASKEITGKDSVPSKTGGTTYGSTLQAISARVSGNSRPSSGSATPTSAASNVDGNAVTTSTLLYVIDRMPGIKSQIQQVLQRTDRTEAQKVEMIARLLKNTKQQR